MSYCVLDTALQEPHFRTNWKSSGVFWTGQTQGVWGRPKSLTRSLVNQSGKGSLITRLRESWLQAGKVSELQPDLLLNKFRYCRGSIDPANGGKGASILSDPEKRMGLSGSYTPAQEVWPEFCALFPWQVLWEMGEQGQFGCGAANLPKRFPERF